MKRSKKILALLLSLVMIFSLMSQGLAAYAAAGGEEPAPETEQAAPEKEPAEEAEEDGAGEEAEERPAPEQAEPLTEEELAELLENAVPGLAHELDREELDVTLIDEDAELEGVVKVPDELRIDDDEQVRVIVLMEDESVIEENSAARPGIATISLIDTLEMKQNRVIAQIESDVLEDQPLEVRYQYTWLLNGFATRVPYGSIPEIESLPGVDRVLIQPVYHLTSAEGDQPLTNSDGGMIGREDTWAGGYTGKGMKIAIVDTGLDDDHPNFGPLPEEKLTAASTTEQAVADALSGLHAYEIHPGLTAGNLYRSTKIPYGFNYVDNSLTIDHGSDNQGDHGTHVAGIAAANKIDGSEVVGVAPDAQLYVMKVFGQKGGAYAEDYMAAIEDAMKLDADVVNLSLGSPAGFTTDVAEFDAIFARVNTTGTILSISAGNSGAMGNGNLWGSGSNLASNPDNATVSSPATYENVLSVASVENVNIQSYYVELGGARYAFSDGSNGPNEPMTGLAGQELRLAAVGNCGQTAADFESANVRGKVALVQRGFTAFTAKAALAQEAGAVACLIYNNISGSIGLDMTDGTATIPCASVSMAAGEAMAAAVAADPELILTVSDKMDAVPNDAARQMSSFSSWGATPDLSLEPDITAPGGNIYSTVDNGGYDTMSGTSMAAPNLSGITALVQQYVKTQRPGISDTDLHALVNSLLMSTAELLTYNGNGLYFSPRNQGAGLANAYNAITTQATLWVKDMDVPKVELKDDPGRTGSYAYRFQVENFGEDPVYYSMSTNVQTEGVTATEDGQKFLSLTPVALDASASMSSDDSVLTYDYNENSRINSHDAYLLWRVAKGTDTAKAAEAFRYDLLVNEEAREDDVQAYLDELVEKDRQNSQGGEIDLYEQLLRVQGGKTADVAVSIQVAQTGKDYMDENFENGIYVEGFSVLSAKSAGAVTLSLPYMGFYGDWTSAPSIDGTFYWDPFGKDLTFQGASDKTPTGSQYINTLWTQIGGSAGSWMPGLNPYDYTEEVDLSHMSLSPNGDGNTDYIDDIYVSLLRNADELSFTYTDDATGEVLFTDTVEHVAKSYYNDSYAQVVPYVYTWYSQPYDLTDADGEPLPNNTKFTLDIAATLDYDEHESTNRSSRWTTQFTVDTEAPVLTGEPLFATTSDGRQFVIFTVEENVAIAAVSFLNARQTAVKAQYLVDDPAPNDDGTRTYQNIYFEITGLGNRFAVVFGDYACNERAYIVETKDNDPVLDAGLLYGYRMNDQYIYDDSVYGWLAIDPATAEATVLDSEYFMDYALTAAEYVDGFVVGAEAGSHNLVSMRPGYWEDRNTIATLPCELRELSLDPVSGKLYGLSSASPPGYSRLVVIDPTDGSNSYLGKATTLSTVWAMSFGGDGTLYAVTSNGELRTINTGTGLWGDTLVPSLGTEYKPSSTYNSMTYDSANNCLYLALFANGNEGALYRIDLDEGADYAVERVGAIAGNAQVAGLLRLDGRGYSLPDTPLESLSFQEEQIDLIAGDKASFSVMAEPWYRLPEKFTWSSDNEEVATVDQVGFVTAHAVGEATITAESAEGVKAVGKVTVIQPKADLLGFVAGGGELYNQWVGFQAIDPAGAEELTEMSFTGYTAGEYVDGVIYAFDTAGAFYRVDPSNGYAAVKLANSASSTRLYVDMAYDYSSGYLYALALNMDMFSGGYYIYAVDPLTGAADVVTMLQGSGYAMTAGPDGTIYVVTDYGYLATVDLESGALSNIGLTGFNPLDMQLSSLAYDHNSGDLYWALAARDNLGAAYQGVAFVNKATGRASYLGAVAEGQSMSCLYTVPANPPARPNVPVEEVQLTQESVLMLSGQTMTAPVLVLPFNASERKLDWAVEDPAVAEIKDGSIHALSAGSTTATGTLGEFQVTLPITVKQSAGSLFGFVMMDLAGMGQNFWARVNDADPSSSNEGLAQYDADTIQAGAYYNGTLYAFGENMEDYSNNYFTFYQINPDPESFAIRSSVSAPSFPDVHDMAFDYTQGVMYAVGADERNSQEINKLYCVDLTTGKCYTVATLSNSIGSLACTASGQLYGMSMDGDLYSIDKVSGQLGYILSTGKVAFGYSAMACDLNTGNLYWAQANLDYMNSSTDASLFLLDPATASYADLGPVGLVGCMVTALYTVPDAEPAAGTPNVSGIGTNTDGIVLTPGESFQLEAQVLPVGLEGPMTCSFASGSDAVATVDASGLVTAVAGGSTEITVTAGAYSASVPVTVLSDSDRVYVVTESGWSQVALTNPGTSLSSVTPEGFDSALNAAAYNGSDGYIYSVSMDGFLWKFTASGESARIGENLLGQTGYGDAQIVDIGYNAFNGQMYVLVTAEYGSVVSLYPVNTENGTLGEPIGVPGGGMGLYPLAFAFVSADTYLVYDGMSESIYRMTLGGGSERLASSKISWNAHIGMVYSQSLGLALYTTGGSLMAIDPNTGTVSTLKDGVDRSVVDLMLFEGVGPSAGPLTVSEEPDEEDEEAGDEDTEAEDGESAEPGEESGEGEDPAGPSPDPETSPEPETTPDPEETPEPEVTTEPEPEPDPEAAPEL